MIVLIIVMIIIPGRHLAPKNQVLATIILEVPGIWNLYFKYRALGTLISEVPGI